jgi:carboxyl-terminal processing protease
LINEFSASASEILAGAFKDSYGSEIIGVNSYGKGTVQRTYQLDTGGMVKLTVEKWLTPSGKWINEKGIEPTTKVELSSDYTSNPSEENDNQLQKALEILSK